MTRKDHTSNWRTDDLLALADGLDTYEKQIDGQQSTTAAVAEFLRMYVRERSEAKPSLFQMMMRGEYARLTCEDSICEILDEPDIEITWDHYDMSFEIFVPESVTDLVVSPAQHQRIMDLGCLRYWVNFADGTELYSGGARRVRAGHNRWAAHQAGAAARRAYEEPESALVPIADWRKTMLQLLSQLKYASTEHEDTYDAIHRNLWARVQRD
jgi:hypothetical protein